MASNRLRTSVRHSCAMLLACGLLVAPGTPAAQTILERIETKVNTIQAKVTDTLPEATQANNKAEAARDFAESGLAAAIEASNHAQNATDAAELAVDAAELVGVDVATALEFMVQARSGVMELSGAINEVLDDVKQQVADMKQGRDQFVGNECGPGTDCAIFRLRLTSLMDGFTGVIDALLTLTPLEAEADPGKLVALIESVPGRALYPLYLALGGADSIIGSDFVTSLPGLADDVRFLASAVLALPSELPGVDACAVLEQDPQRTDRALLAANGASIAFIVLGRVLIASGATHLQGKAGVHGYPGIIVVNNVRKKLGTVLVGGGNGLLALTSAVASRQSSCATARFRQESLERMDLIIAQQEQILGGLPPGLGGNHGNGH